MERSKQLGVNNQNDMVECLIAGWLSFFHTSTKIKPWTRTRFPSLPGWKEAKGGQRRTHDDVLGNEPEDEQPTATGKPKHARRLLLSSSCQQAQGTTVHTEGRRGESGRRACCFDFDFGNRNEAYESGSKLGLHTAFLR